MVSCYFIWEIAGLRVVRVIVNDEEMSKFIVRVFLSVGIVDHVLAQQCEMDETCSSCCWSSRAGWTVHMWVSVWELLTGGNGTGPSAIASGWFIAGIQGTVAR
jgi:hypothetical protein